MSTYEIAERTKYLWIYTKFNFMDLKLFFFLNIKRKIILGESVKTGALEEKMGELSN